MTDAEFMAALLSDGKPRTTMEIVAASIAERGCGPTPHSRAAELRQKRGLKIECRCVGRKDGRAVYSYRLASFEEPLSSASEDDTEIAHGEDVGRGGSEREVEQLALPLPGRVLRKERAA